MSREVRRVPKNWMHPRSSDGQYIPLHDNFVERLRNWSEEKEQWDRGLIRDYVTNGWKPKDQDRSDMTFEEWDGREPKAEDYMPTWMEEERTHLQMYETCTEGTPISPVMKTPEELARWLVDNKASAFGGMTASYEGWLIVAKGESSVGMVMGDGRPPMSGVDLLAESRKK